MTLPALYSRHAREVAAIIRAALRKHGGNVSHAAADLDTPRTTLLRLIESHGLGGEMARKQGRPPKDEQDHG